MTNSSVSALNEIHAAIKSYNPFKNAGIVQEQNIWGKGFPDLTSLNKKASDTVFQALEQVKNSQASHEKVTTLVWTALQGVGKTHNLKRIRKHLEQEGGGLFVYGNANKYTDLNLIKYQFQQTLVNSLAYPGSQGVSQWQEVAAAMANEACKGIDPNAAIDSPSQLVNRFDQVYTDWLNEGENLITTLSQQILQSKPLADTYIVRAILWTLSQTYSPLAIKWLAGDALDQTTADYLGLPPNFNKTNQERESEAFNSVLQILNLVSHYNSVIICFDEIESLKVNDAGFTTPQVIAELVYNLYNSLTQSELGQGVIILTVVLPDVWSNAIKNMRGGIVDRISKYTNTKPINLAPLNSNSILDLVALWLQEELYKPRHLTPPHPVYPFDENQLRDLGKEKPSVREVLDWCAEHFDVPSVSCKHQKMIAKLTGTDNPNPQPGNKYKKLISGVTGTDKLNPQPPNPQPPNPKPPNPKPDYTGKNITGFTFQSSKYEVGSWKELLITVCNLMKSNHESEFEKEVLNLKGSKRLYFSNDSSQLKRSEQIQGTDIYVEINLSSSQIVKNVENIIALFGYPENSISFEIKGEN
jgi:hypothetical protein